MTSHQLLKHKAKSYMPSRTSGKQFTISNSEKTEVTPWLKAELEDCKYGDGD